jgi:hypothetical protein
MMADLRKICCEVQDYLAPQLDGWEQMLYHYVFRHTFLEGKAIIVVPARSIGLKIGKGRKGAIELARNTIPRKLRCLEKKGAIKILGKGREGTRVQVVLPRDIPGLIPDPAIVPTPDLSLVDFYSSSDNRQRILERDMRTCRYCLRSLAELGFTLDHIQPQSENGDHSYKNLVAVCFECNSRRQSRPTDEFLREHYRAGVLSSEDLKSCLQYIEKVMKGEVVPT